MKQILDWLNEAKEQGYEWADAAIRNYDPEFSGLNNAKSLTDAIFFAFGWPDSPEGDAFWKSVTDSLNRPSSADPSPYPLHELALLYEGISERLGVLMPDSRLREPYRQAILEAYRSNYEAELAELTEKIAKWIGVSDKLNRLKKELENVNREFEAHKVTAEELNRSYISEHNENYERMMRIEQLEKELEAVKRKNPIGWIVADQEGDVWRFDHVIRMDNKWVRYLRKRITHEESMELCGRIPKWEDDEPTPIFK